MNIKARTVCGFRVTIIDIHYDENNNLWAVLVNEKGQILHRLIGVNDLTIIDEDYVPKEIKCNFKWRKNNE